MTATVKKYFDPAGQRITDTWWAAQDGTRYLVASLPAEQLAALGVTVTVEEVTGPPPPPPYVPPAVTMRQARLALLGAGVLPQVDAAINSLPEPQKSAARITWEYSAEVQRHNGLVSQMAPALGLTEAQIDALFIQAATL